MDTLTMSATRADAPPTITLDDEALAVPAPTLAGVLAAATAAADAKGRIIIEAVADGLPLDDAQLAAPAVTPLAYRRVALRSADPKVLVHVTLHDAADALEHARKVHEEAAGLIQAGTPERALPKLTESISTWQAVCEVVQKSAALLRLDLDTVPFDGAKTGADALFSTQFRLLTERLSALKQALAVQDWSALADVLAYDLAPAAGAWATMLRHLAGRIHTPR